MIIDFVLLLLGFLLDMIYNLFSFFSFVIPTEIANAIVKFFSYARIGDVFFPMSDILLAIFTIFSVWILMYSVRLVIWVFSLIPFIGKHVNFPKVKAHKNKNPGSDKSKQGQK